MTTQGQGHELTILMLPEKWGQSQDAGDTLHEYTSAIKSRVSPSMGTVSIFLRVTVMLILQCFFLMSASPADSLRESNRRGLCELSRTWPAQPAESMLAPLRPAEVSPDKLRTDAAAGAQAAEKHPLLDAVNRIIRSAEDVLDSRRRGLKRSWRARRGPNFAALDSAQRHLDTARRLQQLFRDNPHLENVPLFDDSTVTCWEAVFLLREGQLAALPDDGRFTVLRPADSKNGFTATDLKFGGEPGPVSSSGRPSPIEDAVRGLTGGGDFFRGIGPADTDDDRYHRGEEDQLEEPAFPSGEPDELRHHYESGPRSLTVGRGSDKFRPEHMNVGEDEAVSVLGGLSNVNTAAIAQQPPVPASITSVSP